MPTNAIIVLILLNFSIDESVTYLFDDIFQLFSNLMFVLCDKILGKNILKPNRKLFSSYTFTCFEDINLVPVNDWTKALNNKNVFLSHSYLSVLHKEKTDHFIFQICDCL